MSDEDNEVIPKGKVANAPETIWLQVGELLGEDVDFRCCEEVTWCVDSQFKDDIRYCRATSLTDSAPDMLKALMALKAIRSECFIPNDGGWLDDKINAAIAKATKGNEDD